MQEQAPAAPRRVRNTGRRVRKVGLICGGVLATASLAACSGTVGSPLSKPGRAPACTVITRLDQIANSVARADVHDPDTFKATLDSAVREYVKSVRQLRAVAPADLGPGLQRVEADVQQYRFDAALTDRSELDSYAARTCGRVVQSVAPGVSTTVGSTAVGANAGANTATTQKGTR